MKKIYLIVCILFFCSIQIDAQTTLFPRKDKKTPITDKQKRYKQWQLNNTVPIDSSHLIGESEYYQDTLILQLRSREIASSKKKAKNSDNDNIENGMILYASVLRYKGVPIDVCPVTRKPHGDWEFDKIHHRFNRNLVDYFDAEMLLNYYEWKDEGNIISYYYSYFYYERTLPPNFSKSIEVIIIKF
ncbi:MAG: hypothetical protein LBH92_07550 [Bacteroidales bacterium]|jgi:hypothetical protein|nr:hypothetical protein [Bacteroidales bacterium]